jgi:hypothetical protein
MKTKEEKQLNVPCIVQPEQESTIHGEAVPSYGLLVINHAYNEGKITFRQWIELSREWAERMKQQYGKPEK